MVKINAQLKRREQRLFFETRFSDSSCAVVNCNNIDLLCSQQINNLLIAQYNFAKLWVVYFSDNSAGSWF